MNPVQHLRLYDNAKALMSLVDGIIYFCGRKQILIVDAPGIDIPGMYSYFKENYNLHIFEKQTLRFEVKVYIGVPESCKDVTSLYYKDKLIVPKSTEHVIIIYSLNGNYFQQLIDKLEQDYVYDEEPLLVCFNLDPAQLNQTVMGKRVEDIQHDIYKNMKYTLSSSIQYNTSVINCLHIGLDDALLNNIATTNNVPFQNVKELLEQRYIAAIRENFEKYDNIIVSEYNKTIVDFLERENYVYELSETNTILDIVRSKYCNHIFIGKANSTLSYYIGLNITNKILL